MAKHTAVLDIRKAKRNVILYTLILILLIVCLMTSSAYITDLRWFHGLTRVCLVDRINLRSFVPYEERQKMILKDDAILKRVLPGGSYKPQLPPDCDQGVNVAVIVPYRNRVENLKIFVPHMHSFLQKQGIAYTVFIIEQSNTSQFNRGLLFNAGFKIASSQQNFSCYVFHDVDMLPENEQNLYTCHKEVRHMSIAVSKYRNSIPYRRYFGGVVSFNKEQFRKINGFSNVYFGWGKEDDDLRTRDDLISTKKKRITSDGLNSLRYELLSLELRDLYTWVYIAIDEEDVMQRYKVCAEKGWPCKM